MRRDLDILIQLCWRWLIAFSIHFLILQSFWILSINQVWWHTPGKQREDPEVVASLDYIVRHCFKEDKHAQILTKEYVNAWLIASFVPEWYLINSLRISYIIFLSYPSPLTQLFPDPSHISLPRPPTSGLFVFITYQEIFARLEGRWSQSPTASWGAVVWLQLMCAITLLCPENTISL